MTDIVRTEVWQRLERETGTQLRVSVEVSADELVLITVSLLHTMFTELGFEQVTT